MRRLFCCLVPALALAGCAANTVPARPISPAAAPVRLPPTPAPAPTITLASARPAPTAAPAERLVFGEAVAYNAGEAVLRLHANGLIEQRDKQAWTPGPQLAPDGTVSHGGKQLERMTRARLADAGIHIDGNEVRAATPRGDLALALWDDGRITANLGPASTTDLRIEGADPGARRTLFLWLSVVAIMNFRNEAPTRTAVQT